MKFTISRPTLKLFAIKYLWLLILLPKMVQFVIYVILLCLLLLKRPIRLNRGVFFIILGALVQVVSILWQCITKDPSLSRVAAGLNTSLIWIVSALYYSLFMEEDEPILKQFHNYFCINLMIMFGIYLFSLVSSASTFNILGHTLYLRRMDYLSSGTTSRFAGLTETVLGPSHFYAFTLPILLIGKDNWKGALLAILGFICVFETHSRMGVICCGGMLLVFLRQILIKQFGIKKIRPFDTFFIITAIVVLILNFNTFTSAFIRFFNARGGSNEARFTIYRKSLETFWNENPLIGCGIKNMIDMGNGYSFPYGSHSMYIGFLYKTGVIGTVFYLLGFIEIFMGMFRGLKNNPNRTSIILIFLCYFVMLIFADLDASDWVIVTMFSVWGILSNEREINLYAKEKYASS